MIFQLALFGIAIGPLVALIAWIHIDRARARAARVWPYGPAAVAAGYQLGPVQDPPVVEPAGVPNGD